MKSHFLPRFYLQGFAVPGSSCSKHGEHVLVLKRGSKWRRGYPAALAKIADLYRWPDETGPSPPELESMFADIESLAAPTIRRLPELPRGEDLKHLAGFIMIQFFRKPKRGQEGWRIFDELAKKVVYPILADPEISAGFEKMCKVLEQHGYADANLTQEDLPRLPPHFHRNFGSVFPLVCSTALLWGPWTFLSTQAPDFFITSDEPVVLKETGRSQMLVDWLASSTVLFPLRRDLAVVITAGTRADKHLRTSLVDATPQRVESFNRDVAAKAEMVISPSKSFPGVEAVADLLSAP